MAARIAAADFRLVATRDSTEVESREGHLVQEWLPLGAVATADLRPFAVRDVLANGRYEQMRHLVVDSWPE